MITHSWCSIYCITQTRMFVECKIGKLQKQNHSVKDISVNGETAKYSWFNSRRCETTNQKNFLNSHKLQQNLPAQVYLPPFWNQLPGSLLLNRANSIVQPLNTKFIDSIMLIKLGPCKRALRNVELTYINVLTSRFSPVQPGSKWLCQKGRYSGRGCWGTKRSADCRVWTSLPLGAVWLDILVALQCVCNSACPDTYISYNAIRNQLLSLAAHNTTCAL